jgi:hypothetical protein
MGYPREKHLSMMRTPDKWPRWPVLPIKRYNPDHHGTECAVMFAVEGYLTTVFLGYLIEAKGPTIADAMACYPNRLKYDDYDAILDDGWIVD